MAKGYIQYKIKTGGGKDPETGFDLPIETSWSDKIPCLIRPNHHREKGHYNGGAFTTSNYDIHIKMQDLPTFDTIRIFDTRGNQLGHNPKVEDREFQVIAPLEYLEVVNRIRIII